MTRISTAERIRHFGEPGDRSCVVTIQTPWDIKVVCHRLAVNVFVSSCAEAVRESRWRPQRIDSYNSRVIRGATSPSLHGFGLAWDFFATPPDIAPPGGVWTPDDGVPAEFAAAFESRGFTWGARWARRDVPHIEWAALPPRLFQQPPPSLPPIPQEEDMPPRPIICADHPDDSRQWVIVGDHRKGFGSGDELRRHADAGLVARDAQGNPATPVRWPHAELIAYPEVGA